MKRSTDTPSPGGATLTFRAADVTGTRDLPVEVQRGLDVGTVARSVASLMRLPDDVPWALRDQTSSAFLDEGRSIGEQLSPGARVTLTPKTHLG